MTDDELRLKLCEVTTECPCCLGTGKHFDLSCDRCIRGRISLLDADRELGLRVECTRCKGSGLDMARWNRYSPCRACGGAQTLYTSREDVPENEIGRGWKPATDPWLYVRAAWQDEHGQIEDRIVDEMVNALNLKQDPGPAAFRGVAKALLGGEA